MGKGILSLQQEMSLEYSEKSYQEVLKIRQESYWKRMKASPYSKLLCIGPHHSTNILVDHIEDLFCL